MKLSIITINFNNRDGLQRTINSVLSQSFKDFEWIVIDGGSTDGSRNLLEIYKNTTVQRNYPIGSVDLNRNHSSDVLV